MEYDAYNSQPPVPKSANGAAEHEVKTMKRLLRKYEASGEKLFTALQNLRNISTEGLNTDPAQRSQGRTSSQLPASTAKLRPGCTDQIQDAELKEAKRLTSTKQIAKKLVTA